jgi:cytochrome c biogenesis protein CcdA/thiol-disulfide isomerase/thioredoxin
MNVASYGLAFLEGLGLILSPCILPILPIVLSLGIEGPRWRPYGIIMGFVVSFSALTLLSRQIVTSFGIDIEVIRYVSFILLFIFALILVSDTLSEKFSQLTSRFANLGERVAQNQSIHSGFWGGCVLGAGIGCIWVPCAGPIMAAVIVQTITQATTLDTAITLMSFSLGTAIPMLILVLMGRRIMGKVSFLKSYTQMVRKILGVIILISITYAALPMRIWSTFSPEPKIHTSKPSFGNSLIHGLPAPYPAPQIAGIVSWINSPPLKLDQLKGKVVLIDFWTYSCINCVRTLPYLKKWDEVYRDKGLVIIGVHSPEFAFERKLENVEDAVKRYGIQYAVALDNDFKTWMNFQNHYWPAHFLIDKQGKIVYTHFGEGEYDITEFNIRVLLGLTPNAQSNQTQAAPENAITPETYLGYDRAERYVSPSSIHRDSIFDYAPVQDMSLNEWSLEGRWFVEKQHVTAKDAHAKIKIHFQAKKVFLVLGSASGKPVTASITLNGRPPGEDAGTDVSQSKVTVVKDTLYELISQESVKGGLLEIEADGPDLQAYAFTFGS